MQKRLGLQTSKFQESDGHRHFVLDHNFGLFGKDFPSKSTEKTLSIYQVSWMFSLP